MGGDGAGGCRRQGGKLRVKGWGAGVVERVRKRGRVDAWSRWD